MDPVFFEVEGFGSRQDQIDLQSLASIAAHVWGDVVEIGSWKGLSTLSIMQGMKQAQTPETGTKRILSFDINHEHNAMELLRAVRTNGFGDYPLCLVPGDFRKTLRFWCPAHIAFAFIDHDHALETTELAMGFLWPLLSPGGIIAFHDYHHKDYPEATEYLTKVSRRRVLERDGMIAFIR